VSRATLTRPLGVVFAGDRRVWGWAALVAVPLAVLTLVWCLIPRSYYTGTDSVNALSVTAPIRADASACARGLNLPAGTARIELEVTSGSRSLPRLAMTLRAGGRVYRSIHAPVTGLRSAVTRVAFPIPRTSAQPSSVPASLCVTAGRAIAYGVTPTLIGVQPPLTVSGKRQLARLAVWYLPPAGARRSYLGRATQMFDRAATFAPGFARPWLFAFVLLGLAPILWFLTVRLLAVAVQGSGRRLALWLYVLVALNMIGWSLVTPAFQAPDEVDQFAYVQSLVQRGQRPTPYPESTRMRWSTSEQNALLGAAIFTDHQTQDSRAPWLPADVATYRRIVRTSSDSTSDGGGFSTMSGYGPLYYLLDAPGYLVAPRGSVFTELGWMRIISALIGALAAVFTFALLRELVPARQWPATLGGLLVGFQPMYGFLSGAVNNDIGVDAAAAAAVWLTVRLARRGFEWPTVAGLGLVLGTLPYFKPSGFDLYPIAVFAVLVVLWRDRARWRARPAAAARAVGSLVVVFVVVYGVATALTAALAAPRPPGAQASVTTAGGTISVVIHHPTSYLTYLWEEVFPRLPFMHAHFPSGISVFKVVLVERAWASFGWVDTQFASWVYVVLEVAIGIVAILAAVAFVRYRSWLARRWPEVVIVVATPVLVIAGYAAAFYTATQRPLVAEMGRYVFPALSAVSAMVVGALHAFGPRRAVAAGGMLLALMLAFNYASQLLMFTSFFG
jgi:4-amino-4-deoxy-L-arabinose transferase-like glycosyltransferase